MRLLLFLMTAGALWAQSADPAHGKAAFVSNCAFCHGVTGEGGRGPNLTTAQSVHGRDDTSLRRVITKGVPGSQMPAFGSFEEPDLADLVQYVKSLSNRAGGGQTIPGDPAHGAALYRDNKCSMCHRIGNEGSVFGPDLSRVGAGRSAAYLRESLNKPSADILPEYQGVVVTTRDGVRASGIRINEDTFTVQLRDLTQKFRLFQKDEVQSVQDPPRSLMPPYILAPKDMDDLVAYLASLQGGPAGTQTRQAEGIR
ncbi:c-type cytochrome [uncultured Paludibaculum sp.]|uniref:c-type cytochrome n=1 Tax=uncultured Paludibaculum sp. TaxID=1765020 RepID=UPI002AAA9A09|nr:c-type cytochrome [uncultured Paludibaculum sp.]